MKGAMRTRGMWLTVFYISICKTCWRIDVLTAEVPDGSVGHTVSGESHDSTNNGSGENVVPVVELVNGQGPTNEACTEDRSVDGNELPHGRVVVGEDLQLRVQVAVEVHESCERCRGMARGHR